MHKTRTESGAKDYQRNDHEDRGYEYKRFHRTLRKDLIASDVDLIEWRFINGSLKAVAVCEITRVDANITVSKNYLAAIIKRYEERDLQAKMIRKVAANLETNAYIILYQEGCREFWVYNLSQMKGWWHVTKEKYIKWLEGVGR